MRKIMIFCCFVMVSFSLSSQNKQILYGFAELPQTLLLNPGAETNYKYHAGIPGLSGIYVSVGSSEVNLEDLFYVKGSFEEKLNRLVGRLNDRDFLNINVQLDILNGGYRLDEKTYLNFGFYEELDLIAYYPKDIFELMLYGNANFVNRSFSASQINFNADLIGALHIGVSRRIDKKLTVGARLKIYSGVANLSSNKNSGTFTTVQGANNIYRHYLNNIDLTFKTAGLYNSNNQIDNFEGNIIGRSLLGGSLGLGVDFGFTYHITPQWEITGSILDLGFINYSKDIRNVTVKGSYTFEGVNFEFGSNRDYWQELDADFTAKLPRKDNNNSYLVWRPTKINAAAKYSFGKVRSQACYSETFKEYYSNAVGVQLYSIIRPLGPQLAATAFFEANVSENFKAKATYTIDSYSYSNVGDYSYSNLGLGMSANFGIVNIYGTLDNLLKLDDLGTANSMSFQFGVNLIFD